MSAVPLTEGKRLACRLAVWLLHRALHSAHTSAERLATLRSLTSFLQLRGGVVTAVFSLLPGLALL